MSATLLRNLLRHGYTQGQGAKHLNRRDFCRTVAEKQLWQQQTKACETALWQDLVKWQASRPAAQVQLLSLFGSTTVRRIDLDSTTPPLALKSLRMVAALWAPDGFRSVEYLP